MLYVLTIKYMNQIEKYNILIVRSLPFLLNRNNQKKKIQMQEISYSFYEVLTGFKLYVT